MLTLLVMMLVMGNVSAGQDRAPAKKLQRPADWVTRTDPGGESTVPLDFVSMPPGWHITTGPGTILYDPKKACTARCRVEAEIFLFPGKGEGGYGVFVGGTALEHEAGPTYDAFLLRWDGASARGTWLNGARQPSFAWRTESAAQVAQGLPDKPVKNVMAIEIDNVSEPRVARFFVNGQQLSEERHAASAGGRSPFAGTVGLRVDGGVNLHVTRLDVVAR